MCSSRESALKEIRASDLQERNLILIIDGRWVCQPLLSRCWQQITVTTAHSCIQCVRTQAPTKTDYFCPTRTTLASTPPHKMNMAVPRRVCELAEKTRQQGKELVTSTHFAMTWNMWNQHVQVRRLCPHGSNNLFANCSSNPRIINSSTSPQTIAPTWAMFNSKLPHSCR